jgi:multicomponent Na+:H+ antiporter subunit G
MIYVFSVLFLLLGMLVNTLGTISLFRFPDVYTRMHGSSVRLSGPSPSPSV